MDHLFTSVNPLSARNLSWEAHFSQFRAGIIGHEEAFETPYGRKRLLYADWIASGRLYKPIENRLLNSFGPYVGNTHTETSVTGTAMTKAYHHARHVIKQHVNASDKDAIIACGSGMTGAVNKFQRILGLKLPESLSGRITLSYEERPLVVITHMEHHSNHTSWLETMADVEIIAPNHEGMVDLSNLREILARHTAKKVKIAAVSACSNVTGIIPPFYEIASIMHQNGGYCFVDFACSAPYVEIDMHPTDPLKKLDAVFFSPHKFLGGPGTPGIMVFDAALYRNAVPDHPGGGTVKWTNPWNEHSYIDDIEDREDGGTPPFLQTIKAALCMQLKDQMGTIAIKHREEELVQRIFPKLKAIPGLKILAGEHQDRLGVISFYLEDTHYNLVVKLLNDRFGIQVRGGCSCAGTYGHYLLHVTRNLSNMITTEINQGNLSHKPGWVRLSLHPTMTNQEVDFIAKAIADVAENYKTWLLDYRYEPATNEFIHHLEPNLEHQVYEWFSL